MRRRSARSSTARPAPDPHVAAGGRSSGRRTARGPPGGGTRLASAAERNQGGWGDRPAEIGSRWNRTLRTCGVMPAEGEVTDVVVHQHHAGRRAVGGVEVHDVAKA